MQKQNIIFIPPSEEQAYAVFHVTSELAGAFLAYLAARHIEVRNPPEPIGQLGPKSQTVVEIEVLDDQLSISTLEKIVGDFFAT